MTEEIFVFCGWGFSNQLDIVSETHFSCNAVDHGLWLAILNSLLCPEMDRNISIGNQDYVFYFTDFKVHLTPKYFFRSNKCLHLFEMHCTFLSRFNPNLDFLQAVKVTKSGHHL